MEVLICAGGLYVRRKVAYDVQTIDLALATGFGDFAKLHTFLNTRGKNNRGARQSMQVRPRV